MNKYLNSKNKKINKMIVKQKLFLFQKNQLNKNKKNQKNLFYKIQFQKKNIKI